MVRRLNAEGAQLEGIHYLRALANAESLRRDAEEAEPLERGFGARAGHWFRGVLESHGVEVVGEGSVEAFTGGERVEAVQLDDGRSLPADVVVVGVGVLPDVMLARKSGLELGDTGGVRCDAQLRTSAEGVYAAGDVCEYAS